MKPLPLAAVLTLCASISTSVVHAAETKPERQVVGRVTARAGTLVVIAVGEGQAVKPSEELAVGRGRLLVSLAQSKKKTDVWADWQEAGTVKIRLLRGDRFAFATIISDAALRGIGGRPAPNIRAGDLVYRRAP
jgi:hypothetical protein